MSLEATFTLTHADGTTDTMSTSDPFLDVYNPGVPHAKVSIMLGSPSVGYGDKRVNVTLTLECDQDATTIDYAIQLAYDKVSATATTLFERWALGKEETE